MRATNSPPAEAERGASLVARARAGERAAFEEIVSGYQEEVYDYVYRIVGSADEACQLTQEVFFKAYLGLPKTREDVRVPVWLCRIATKVCLDALRRSRRVFVFRPRAKRSRGQEVPQGGRPGVVSVDELAGTLARLQPKQRACLVLRECQGLSYEEMAEVLGMGRAAVQSLLFRAREELRRANVEFGATHAA